jgi:hypothetical protein
MRSERIRALPSWRNGPSRYHTVLVSTDRQLEGMIGLDVARVVLRQLWLHSGFSREPTSANMLAKLSHIWL